MRSGLRAVPVAAALALLAACTAPRGASRATATDAPTPLPALTAQEILAPVQGAGHVELERMQHLPDVAPVRLRRAYLRIAGGETDQAVRELNRLIFGEPPPTPAVESFARYLRALAYERQGDRQRAAHDRALAAELAQTADLQQLLAATEKAPATRARQRSPADVPCLSREAWRAARAEPRRMDPMGRIDKLTIHHSALLADDDAAGQAASVLRSIQKTHIQGNGWGDIGYHFLIDRAGRVWGGRELRFQGAHAGDPTRNRGNVGICLLGNFVRSRAGQDPSPAQIEAMENLVYQLCAEHRIPPSGVLTHRELNDTVCPGERLQAAVDDLRRAMAGSAVAASR